MESEYQQFQFPASASFRFPHSVNLQTGVKKTLVYVPYGLLLLLLIILLLLAGIKFGQLHEEIRDVKVHLKTLSHEWEAYTGGPEAEEEDILIFEKITPVQGSCKSGWMSFQRRCYLFSTNTSFWRQAEQDCASHGGHLLSLNSIEELDYISKIIPIHRNYWIGLVEGSREGLWSWVDGTPFDPTVHHWDVGQPDNWQHSDGDEDCGQIHNSANRIRKLLNDGNCNRSFHYICEAGDQT